MRFFTFLIIFASLSNSTLAQSPECLTTRKILRTMDVNSSPASISKRKTEFKPATHLEPETKTRGYGAYRNLLANLDQKAARKAFDTIYLNLKASAETVSQKGFKEGFEILKKTELKESPFYLQAEHQRSVFEVNPDLINLSDPIWVPKTMQEMKLSGGSVKPNGEIQHGIWFLKTEEGRYSIWDNSLDHHPVALELRNEEYFTLFEELLHSCQLLKQHADLGSYVTKILQFPTFRNQLIETAREQELMWRRGPVPYLREEADVYAAMIEMHGTQRVPKWIGYGSGYPSREMIDQIFNRHWPEEYKTAPKANRGPRH